MDIYTLDNKDIWNGGKLNIDPYGPVPSRFSPVEPPDLNGCQVAKWVSGAWKILDSYPSNPLPVMTPEMEVLSTDRWVIPADATTFATVNYTSDDAVIFIVNDDIYEVEPVSTIATLEITADAAGPILVCVKDKQLIITAE